MWSNERKQHKKSLIIKSIKKKEEIEYEKCAADPEAQIDEVDEDAFKKDFAKLTDSILSIVDR